MPAGRSPPRPSLATVAPASLTAGAGVAVTGVEGMSFTAQLGTFTTGDPIANTLQFSALIAWGDGTTSTGTITQSSSGLFSVTGTHTYAEEGTFPITATVTDNNVGGLTATIGTSATIADAPLSSSGVGVNVVEGTAVPVGTIVASFSDADPLGAVGDYTATINFGDGTAPVTATVTIGNVGGTGGANSGFIVSLATPHIYVDSGNDTMVVTITDAGGSVTTASSTAVVTEATVTVTGTPVSAIEGNSSTAQVATFVDADPFSLPSDFTAQVNFGDGIIAQGVITQPGGIGTPYIVTATHTYQTFGFGTYPITTTITDSGTYTAVGTSTATVAGAALTPGAAATVTGTEGVPFTHIVGTFTSANPLALLANFTAVISWGDGTPTSLGTITEDTAGVFTVTGTHTYAEETGPAGVTTPYVITTTVRSTAAVTATLTASATIADAPLQASPIPVNTVEGLPRTLTVATFTDTDPNGTAGDYTATINWGDGTITTSPAITFTSTGAATALGASFSVSADHTYLREGNYTAVVTINDKGGSTATTASTVAVAAARLSSAGIAIVGQEGVLLINVPIAAFVDFGGPDTEADYTATIDFGDGTPQIRGLITLSGDGHTFIVSGSHDYARDGLYSVHVFIQSSGGATTVALTTATIGETAVAISGALDPASDSGVSHTDNITNVNQPTFNGTAEAGAVVNLFAANTLGTLFIGTGVAGAGGHYSIRSDVALPDGAYVIYSTSYVPGDITPDVTGPTFLLGANGVSPLVIDTVGPVVTEAIFRRPLGSVMIAFQDQGGGLTAANIQDGADYNFRVLGKSGNLPNLITGFNTISSGTNNDPYEMFIRINNGRPLKTGRYVLTIKSGGITDIAGNALDGEYYGYVPSGNGKPGGDFQALLISGRDYTFRPIPTTSSATPVTPPGKKGQGFNTTGQTTSGGSTAAPHATRTVAIKAAHGRAIVAPTVAPRAAKAVASPKVHDAALAHVTVSKKK